jgi:hypothetical protein
VSLGCKRPGRHPAKDTQKFAPPHICHPPQKPPLGSIGGSTFSPSSSVT